MKKAILFDLDGTLLPMDQGYICENIFWINGKENGAVWI